jgi:exosortase
MAALASTQNRFSVSELCAAIAATWRQFPHRGVFWALLAGWLMLFQFWGNSTFGYINTASLFRWTHYAYQMSPDDGHGYFIPLLVLVLLWWKREELLALPKQAWWPALGLLLMALGIHVVGFLVQQTRVSIVGFFFGIYALSGIVWGYPWLRATFFAFCLFAFCVPIASHTEILTFPLRMLATNITVFIAHTILGIDVIQKGTAIFDPSGRYQYEIAAACSGIRSLIALFAVTLVYGYLFASQFWRRGLIVLVAFPAAIVSNVLRLLMIIVAAKFFGQKGGDYVHNNSVLSFLPYLAGFGLVFFVGRLLERKWTHAPADGSGQAVAEKRELTAPGNANAVP